MGNSPMLADLVPRRNSTYALILLGGVVVIVSLGLLYVFGLQLAPLTTDGKLAAFDLDAEGSVASWFSIVLLFMCGLTTLLVRRLRSAMPGCAIAEVRSWLAVGVVWFTMSLDEAASLHEGFKELMALVTGTRLMGDGSIYWVIPYFFVLSAVGFFLLWFARRTPSAVLCLCFAGACYVLALMSQMELILRGMGPFQVWIEESCEMLGDLFILLTLGLYARSLVPVTASVARSETRDYHRARGSIREKLDTNVRTHTLCS